MRTLLIAIVIGALAYFGWTRQSEVLSFVQRVTSKVPAPSDGSPVEGQPPAGSADAPGESPLATPVPKRVATPGVYFVTKRVSVQTDSGVKALNPGEEVRLMYRNKDGTVRVAIGNEEFLIKEALLTNDPDKAASFR